MLDPSLPEDKGIRDDIHQQILVYSRMISIISCASTASWQKAALDQQQREREDQATARTCLFCKEQFVGDRQAIFMVSVCI